VKAFHAEGLRDGNFIVVLDQSRFAGRGCEGIIKEISHVRNEGNVSADILIRLNRYGDRDRK
jgi:hypothetical protein